LRLTGSGCWFCKEPADSPQDFLNNHLYTGVRIIPTENGKMCANPRFGARRDSGFLLFE